jgi:4'-phosphopantetheinyl transferase
VRPEDFEATDAALALLTDDERTAQQRFVTAPLRHDYLVTRVAVRTVLGRALGVPPPSLRFVRNQYGRPELTPSSSVRFNLSNTSGLICVLVSAHHEVGVDTERFDRAPTLLKLAPTVFAPTELDGLLALEVPQRGRRAMELWTLKEAYIKARGMGLALPLKKFAFTFGEGLGIEFDPELGDDAARWQFQHLELGPHLIATAVAQPTTAPVRVTVREVDLPAMRRVASGTAGLAPGSPALPR